ncbi:MAG: RagB/SusD family nutrient uptake outer membrane protein [Mangrovibacterium sp.]
MKTYNIIFKITAWIVLLTNFTSCSDFLSEKPESLYTKDNYFQDMETLQAGVVGIYAGLINLYVINTNTPIFLTMIGTDELCYRAANTNVRSLVDRYEYTPTEGCIQECWLRYYRIITRSNTVISAAQKVTGITDEQRNSILAECYFLRSWAYFQLVQLYGDLPLMLDDITEFDYSVGRSPLADVYAQIIEDLKFASTDGYLSSSTTDGHPTVWAAKTLLGKVYLTMASAKKAAKVEGYAGIEQSVSELYQLAYQTLDDVIENSDRDLLPVYSDVFKISNKNKNAESIWEIQFSAEEPYGTQWAKEMGLTNTGYSQTAGGWRYCTVGGSYSLNAVPSFRGYYKHWNYDKRKSWNLMDSLITYNATTGVPTTMRTILGLSGIPNTSTHEQLCLNSNTSLVTRTSATKYRWISDLKTGYWLNDYPISYIYSNCPNNIIALRFADVLLMFTEADMQLNNGVTTDKGLTAINRVVQRARGLNAQGMPVTETETPGFPNYTAATLTFEELMKERACELCFEFWRRHDLARTGMFEYFLADRNSASNLKTNFDASVHYLLPIPQYEIDNSQNKEGMYQNKGYVR